MDCSLCCAIALSGGRQLREEAELNFNAVPIKDAVELVFQCDEESLRLTSQ